ncbi:MAG: hypothetical protein KDK45_24975, partial [Leptospiraceae bacterium]|nr:hypothetical protein [Leptospiraceae bacterium]
MLTGNITQSGNFIFINGDVIDIKTQRVDFSENVIFEETNKDVMEKSIEFFAKKITGGTMSYLENQVLPNPYQGAVVKWPMIWRSSLVPGWGQKRDGSIKKAYSFFGGTLFGIATYGYMYAKLLKENKVYEDFRGIPYLASSSYMQLYYKNTFLLNYMQNNTNRSRVDAAKKNVAYASYFLAALWTINILDVVYYA